MAKTYRLGVVGFAHMHINELIRKFDALPNVEWVACADTRPTVPELVEARNTRAWNVRQAHEVIGIPKVYDDYEEMLDKERFDIVLFCPENARHGEVGRAIAAHGAHLVTEKPMAARLEDAKIIAGAAEEAGLKLMVNWPSTWSPSVRKIKELVEAGAIGQLLEVKCRYGSQGPLSHGSVHPGVDGRMEEITDEEKGATWWHHSADGGGALLDYCCYGACLSRWYVGEPAVEAIGFKANLNSHYGDAEDNAVITVRFPNAMALLEATWSCADHAQATGPILYGSKGTMRLDKDGVWLLEKKGAEPRIVTPDPLPAGRANLAEEFINHLETGAPLHPTLEPKFNLEAMAILEAGILSAETGAKVAVEQFT